VDQRQARFGVDDSLKRRGALREKYFAGRANARFHEAAAVRAAVAAPDDDVRVNCSSSVTAESCGG
jgi:hypothetical protein